MRVSNAADRSPAPGSDIYHQAVSDTSHYSSYPYSSSAEVLVPSYHQTAAESCVNNNQINLNADEQLWYRRK